jgi:hypothetical protein
MTLSTFTPLPGAGLVARAGDLLLVVADQPGADQVLRVFATAAADGVDGNTLVRRVVALLAADEDGRLPACALGGPSQGRFAVLVYGSATAEVTGADGLVRLSGADAITAVSRFVPGPVTALRLLLPGAQGAPDTRLHLAGGVVTGAGLAATAGAHPMSALAAPAAMAPQAGAPAAAGHPPSGQPGAAASAGQAAMMSGAPAGALAPEPARMAAEPAGMQVESPGMMAAEPARMAAEPAGMAAQPAGMQVESAGMQAQPAGMQAQPAGMQVEPAGMMAPGQAAMAAEPAGMAVQAPVGAGAVTPPATPVTAPPARAAAPVPPQPPLPQPPIPQPPVQAQPAAAYQSAGQAAVPLYPPPPPLAEAPAPAPPPAQAGPPAAAAVPSLPRVPDAAKPFESVILLPGIPLPEEVAAAPVPATPVDPRPMVLGVLCKNDHFNDPDLRYCQVCGISMAQQTLIKHEGPRPPLGVLLFDDGMTFRLDIDYLVGREPGQDPAVTAGVARPLRLADAQNQISRVHLRVALVGWQVQLVDQSANGTYLRAPGQDTPARVNRGQAVPLKPGAQIYLGQRWFRYESHRNP